MQQATHTTATGNAVLAMHAVTPAAAPSPAISIIGAQQNELLRALSREELVSLFDHLELVPLTAGKHLFSTSATKWNTPSSRPMPSSRCSM